MYGTKIAHVLIGHGTNVFPLGQSDREEHDLALEISEQTEITHGARAAPYLVRLPECGRFLA